MLLVAVLGLGVWSAPAWSLPLREANGRDESKHADLSIRSEKSGAADKHSKHAKQHKWLDERWGSIARRGDSTSGAPAVPEPGALMLFGVGFLLTRRALTRAQR